MKKGCLLATFIFCIVLWSCQHTTQEKTAIIANSKHTVTVSQSIALSLGKDFSSISIKDCLYIFQLTPSIESNLTAIQQKTLPLCPSWELTPQEVKTFLRQSKIIEGTTWDIEFNHLPCAYTGYFWQNGSYAQFEINAGAWGYLKFADTVYRVGYYGKEVKFLD